MVAMGADRTILVKIHMEFYSISWDVIETIFAPFGVIEYIEVFCPGEEFHSKIRFKNRESAIEALECINRRDVYDGCCQLELFLEANLMGDNLQRSESRLQMVQQLAAATHEFFTNSIQAQEVHGNLLAELKRSTETFQEKAEQWLSKIDQTMDELTELVRNRVEGDQLPLLTETNDAFEETQVQPEIFEVNSNPSEAIIFDVASKGYGYLLTEWIGIKSDDVKIISDETFENLIALKVFVEMSTQAELAFVVAATIVRHGVQAKEVVFDPGIAEICTKINKILMCGNVSQGRVQAQEFEIVDSISLHQDFEANSEGLAVVGDEFSGRLVDQLRWQNAMPYDRGKEESMSCCLDSLKGGFSLNGEASGAGGINITPSFDQHSCISVPEFANSELRFIRNGQSSLPFDRGKANSKDIKVQLVYGKVILDSRVVTTSCFHLRVITGASFRLKFSESHLFLMTFDKGRAEATADELQGILISMEISFPFDRGRAAATFIGLSKSWILVFDPGGFLLSWEEASVRFVPGDLQSVRLLTPYVGVLLSAAYMLILAYN